MVYWQICVCKESRAHIMQETPLLLCQIHDSEDVAANDSVGTDWAEVWSKLGGDYLGSI